MKKIINISIWVLFIVGVLVLLSFSQSSKNKTVSKEVSITINTEDGNHFMTNKRVNTILTNMGYSFGSNTMSQLDTRKIENKLLGLSCVKSVIVHKNLNGKVAIKIEQRKPIARIFNGNGTSIYIDENGKIMPVSEYYTSRVLVVNGYFNLKSNQSIAELNENDSLKNSSLLDEIFALASHINKNDFLKAQIEQIYIEKNKEITLIPKVGNQKIIFGKLNNNLSNSKEIEEKMDKLILFYTKGINPENLNLYRTINLTYNNQIICKKIQ